ncbi:MAG: 4Fe-4S binding protein [Ruminococcus sp.]|jgi:ech hydrogenase subunit F
MGKTKIFTFAGTALKNLFSKPATKNYPAQPAVFTERMRGHVVLSAEKCIGCGLCARSCPPGALQVNRKENTWSINRFDCVQCGSCVNACPKKCLQMQPGYTQPDIDKHTETFQIPEKAKPAKPVKEESHA